MSAGPQGNLGEIGGFDAKTVEPNSFEPLPAGEYDVVIVESTWEITKAQTGKFLKLKLQVLNGKYQNRTLYDRLNLINPNATAVTIARGTLSAICRSVNILTPADSSQLHNIPLKAVVKVEHDPVEGPGNAVKGYKPRLAPPAAGGQPPAGAPPANPLAATPANPLATQQQIAPPLNTGTPAGPANPFA